MPNQRPALTKRTLDKDLDKLTHVEDATRYVLGRLLAPSLGIIFLGVAMLFAGGYVFGHPGAMLIIAGAALAAYMAMNIGANDVTNNVGAAVGARAMTMAQALVIAAIFEILGATIAGGPVVRTISSNIVPAFPAGMDTRLAWMMMAALLAAAAWINLATWLNAPVSTTHSIVGAVIGAGAAAVGPQAINWRVMLEISAGWVISPLLGGLIAAGLLYLVKTLIIYQTDKISAARRWVPVLIAIMTGAFCAYMVVQLTTRAQVPSMAVLGLGLCSGAASWFVARPLVMRQSVGLENRNSALKVLFRLPLIGSAALLSFAHGANDVSNAIGPLSAIVRSAGTGAFGQGDTPLWVMLIGAFGISVGLLLFGPRLIRLVGDQITRLNPMRAYCVALSAAVTVIVASWLGLPVSTTHIAVGSVFGVGFFREWYTRNSKRRVEYMRSKAEEWDIEEPEERNVDEVRRRYLVRRSHFITIIAAWAITVPASAALAAAIYWAMFALLV